MILMEVFIFRRMSLLSGFWKFILDNESYLDCKILTSDNQTVITNKCFLINFMSIYLSEYQDEEFLTIMMPFHSSQEIYRVLRGFCKTSSPYIVSTEFDEQTSFEIDQGQSVLSVDSKEKRPFKEVRNPCSASSAASFTSQRVGFLYGLDQVLQMVSALLQLSKSETMPFTELQ